MNETERIRCCPCGQRLKANQEKYCCCQHKGKYHRDAPKEKNFGLVVPKDKTPLRIGKGLLAYLDEWPV
jgi:hypothetical protein